MPRALILAGLGAALLVAGLAAPLWLAGHGPSLLWLGGGPGHWIVAPIPPQVRAQVPTELETRFERSFEAEAGATQLRLRALGRATATLNGQVVATPDAFPESWKQTLEVDVSEALQPGPNHLQVSVLRSGSPAALNLALGSLASDESWTASRAGASPRPARLATRRPAPDPGLSDPVAARPLAALAASLPWLGACAALALLLAAGLLRCPERWKSQVPDLAMAVAVFAWLALYMNNAGQLLETSGFDARHHLDYIRHVVESGRLPLGDEGWQMYQPPLFYVLCAALASALGGDAVEAPLLRALTLGAGIAQILLLGAIARLLWPERPLATVLALAFGACLPMHLYLFHFVSNETLAMALNTGVTYLALRLLLRPGAPSLGSCIALGACLGLALLAKFSSLVLAPLALGAAVAAFAREGSGARAAARGAFGLLAACTAVCGWHYIRVWSELDHPFIGNWDPSLGFEWWQDPGYRTLAHYASFGRALVAPWFAGFGGVLDGVWSTLWGDGLASGSMQVQYGAPWNHRLMSAGYALSILPAALIAAGAAIGTARWLRGDLDGRRSAAALYLATLAVLVLAALLTMSLRVPSYAQAKAFYLQPAMPALAVAFVIGTLAWVDRAGRFRALPLVLLAICAFTFYGSVWVRPAAPWSQTRQGWAALGAGDPARAQLHFREALEREPAEVAALGGLAVAQAEQERWRRAARLAERALPLLDEREQPRLAGRLHGAAADAALALGRPGDAERGLRRAIELAPAELPSYRRLAQLLLQQQRDRAAADVLRDALWITPQHPEIRRLLGEIEGRR